MSSVEQIQGPDRLLILGFAELAMSDNSCIAIDRADSALKKKRKIYFCMEGAPTWPLSGGGGSKGLSCSTRYQPKQGGFNTCPIYCQESRDMKPSDLTVIVFLEGVDKCYGRHQGV